MSFLLRAALVIGALSYLAAVRGGGPAPSLPSARDLMAGLPAAATPVPGAGTDLRGVMKGLPDLAASLPAAWNALPPEARERAARDGLAILAGQAPPASSRDTLGEADRVPQWQGPPRPAGRSSAR